MEGEPADVVELHRVNTELANARRIEAALAAGVDPGLVTKKRGRRADVGSGPARTHARGRAWISGGGRPP